jgi:hypothetical protein
MNVVSNKDSSTNTEELVSNKDSSTNTEELVSRKDIKDSPFVVIGIKEKKQFFGVMGSFRVTEVYKTEKEVETELSKITWNRIIQVMLLLLEQQESLTEKNK